MIDGNEQLRETLANKITNKPEYVQEIRQFLQAMPELSGFSHAIPTLILAVMATAEMATIIYMLHLMKNDRHEESRQLWFPALLLLIVNWYILTTVF